MGKAGSGGRVKAKIKRVSDNLVLLETEYGQKCIIPDYTLCDFINRYNIEIDGNHLVKCTPKKISV